jgi:toxin ParE1/3/4
MRLLRIAERARREIDDIYEYGEKHYGDAPTVRYVARLTNKLNLLADHPFIGTERREVRPPIRLLIHEAHNVFYDVTDTEVIVQRILYHRVDWQNEL